MRIALNVRHMPYITYKRASSAVSSVLAMRIVYSEQYSDGAVNAGNALNSENSDLTYLLKTRHPLTLLCTIMAELKKYYRDVAREISFVIKILHLDQMED